MAISLLAIAVLGAAVLVIATLGLILFFILKGNDGSGPQPG